MAAVRELWKWQRGTLIEAALLQVPGLLVAAGPTREPVDQRYSKSACRQSSCVGYICMKSIRVFGCRTISASLWVAAQEATRKTGRKGMVKAADTVASTDAGGLATLRDEAGERFVRGLVLYTGEHRLPLGDRIEAAPIASLWA